MWDVFRPHILDWVVFVLITAGSIALDSVHPFQQFVNADYMQKYMYPLKPDSYHFGPFRLIFTFPLTNTLKVMNLIRAPISLAPISFPRPGYVFNCATTFLLTNALKVSIGRPRPTSSSSASLGRACESGACANAQIKIASGLSVNSGDNPATLYFFIVCFPSGFPVYGSDGNAQCNGSSSSVMESRVSFPRHSMSFAGLTYAALFLAAKLQAFSARGRGQLWRLVPSACCLAGAASVGITRIDDYWHFPFDVFIGGSLGSFTGRPTPLHVLCAVLFVSREWMTTGTSPFDDFMGGLMGKRSLTRRHMPVQVEGEGPAVAGGAISMQPGGRCFHGHHSS
ncbi:unnamed protein product [Closterium sp. NIES-64]|nr:unnamed protein product [Closterium sp. NIES-64]